MEIFSKEIRDNYGYYEGCIVIDLSNENPNYYSITVDSPDGNDRGHTVEIPQNILDELIKAILPYKSY